MRIRRVAVRLPSTAAMRVAVVVGFAVAGLSTGQVLSSGLNVTVSEVPYTATVGASAADVSLGTPVATSPVGPSEVTPTAGVEQPSVVSPSPADSLDGGATPTQSSEARPTPAAEPTTDATTPPVSVTPEPTTSPDALPRSVEWNECTAPTVEPAVQDPSAITLDCGAAQLRIPALVAANEAATPDEPVRVMVITSDETQIGKTIVLGNRISSAAEPAEIVRAAVTQVGETVLQLPPNGVTGDEHWTLALL